MIQDIEAIHEKGHLVLRGAFSAGAAAAMSDVVWAELERLLPVRRDDPATWPTTFPATQATGLQALKSLPVFEPIGGRAVTRALDAIFGPRAWDRPGQWGQFLVNFPERERPGPLANGIWHTDFPYDEGPMPGAVVFSLLADVKPGAGGTLVVEGSHRLLERYVRALPEAARSGFKATRTAFMAGNRWLKDLSEAASTGMDSDLFRNRFMDVEAEVDGVSVRVSELTGHAGDMVICHPWQLHAPARNHGRAPRMMRIQRVRRSQQQPALAGDGPAP